MEQFNINSITKNDQEKVLAMLETNFFRDEPLNAAAGFINEPESCRSLREYCRKIIAEDSTGLSVAAYTPSGHVVGVCLNCCVYKKDQNHYQSVEINNNNKPSGLAFTKIMNLLKLVEEKCKVFDKYPEIDKLLDMLVLSVDDSYRGKGIAKELINKSREIAKNLNIPLIQIVCSSYFSAKAAARLGFRSIYVFPYSEYVDNDNQQIIEPTHPHTQVEVYVLELNGK